MKTKQGEEAGTNDAQAEADSNRIGDIELPAPINLARGVKLENVLAYLELRFSQAKTGDVNAAEALFQIANFATSTVGIIFESHEELLKPLLRRVAPASLPLMMKRKCWPKRLTDIADTRSPNKTRSDASAPVTEKMRQMADGLYREWKKHAASRAQDDKDGAPAKIIEKKILWQFKKIMSPKGWARRKGEAPIQGQDEAIKLLPPPSKSTAPVWWKLANVILSRKIKTPEGFWYLDASILKHAGKPKGLSLEKARGIVLLQYQNAFKQAVARLVDSELQVQNRDDKQG